MRNRGSFRIITEVAWPLTVLFVFHCYSTYGPNPPPVVNIIVDGEAYNARYVFFSSDLYTPPYENNALDLLFSDSQWDIVTMKHIYFFVVYCLSKQGHLSSQIYISTSHWLWYTTFLTEQKNSQCMDLLYWHKSSRLLFILLRWQVCICLDIEDYCLYTEGSHPESRPMTKNALA